MTASTRSGIADRREVVRILVRVDRELSKNRGYFEIVLVRPLLFPQRKLSFKRTKPARLWVARWFHGFFQALDVGEMPFIEGGWIAIGQCFDARLPVASRDFFDGSRADYQAGG